MAETKRRALGEDAIYFDHRGACRDALKHRHCPGRWLGVVSLGFGADGKRTRRKVYGRTKTDVKDKRKQLHEELEEGIRPSATYTVQQACDVHSDLRLCRGVVRKRHPPGSRVRQYMPDN